MMTTSRLPDTRLSPELLQTLSPWLGNLPAAVRLPLTSIETDSRRVQPGSLFIALASLAHPEQTRQHIAQAIAAGAALVVSEQPADTGRIPALVIPQIRQLIGPLVREYLQHVQPVRPVRVSAVTGTNGKTTVSRLVAELLSLLGEPAAIVGTTGNGILPHITPATHTTPDAATLQHLLHDFALQGAHFASLEASSHGLDQYRLNGTPVETGIFTNLTRDHLDYHGTLDEYLAAKIRLFDFAGLHTAILNADDPAVRAAGQTLSHIPRVFYYATEASGQDHAGIPAPLYIADRLQTGLYGACFDLVTPEGSRHAVTSPLLGRFNVGNLLAAILATRSFGFSLSDIIDVVPRLRGAAGRMQLVRGKQVLGVVDYAHTPDALQQALESLRGHVEGQLRVVFGCGGDRDRGKRPLMTRIALEKADQVILTADNPRSEPVTQILADMQQELTSLPAKMAVIADRGEAIRHAIKVAAPGDIVLVAGKGHEDYQEVLGQRHSFDDVQVLQTALEQSRK